MSCERVRGRVWPIDVGFDSGLGVGSGGLASKSNLHGFGVETPWKQPIQLFQQRRRKVDIVGPAALLVVKVRVGPQIRTIARRTALEVHGSHQVALNEGFETVIDRGEGDRREFGLYANINLIRCRVVALLEEYAVNNLALWGSAEPAVREPLRERMSVFRFSHVI